MAERILYFVRQASRDAFEGSRSILPLVAELFTAVGELERDPLVRGGYVRPEPRDGNQGEPDGTERDNEVFRARMPVMWGQRWRQVPHERVRQEG